MNESILHQLITARNKYFKIAVRIRHTIFNLKNVLILTTIDVISYGKNIPQPKIVVILYLKNITFGHD